MAAPAAARSFVSFLAFAASCGLATAGAAVQPGGPPAARTAGYGALPLRFEPNVGQMDGRVLFRSRAAGHDLFLTADEAVIAVTGASSPLSIRLAGSRPADHVAGEQVLPGRTHYYLGNDPGRWRTHVPAYGRVRYGEVYPGIDVVYYGSGRQLEYDFVVAPGADPSVIALDIGGADGVRLSPAGELVLASGPGEIRQRRPVLYQEDGGRRQTVEGRYLLRGPTTVGFEVGAYDRTRPLVIDPVITLEYSTYFGGSNAENSIYSGIAVDAEGAAYIVGNTFSADLPGTVPGSKPGGTSGDVFVAKISPAGDAIEYAVYLGGTRDEEGQDIAIDPAGNAYIVGFVHQPGTGFPILNAFQPTLQGGLGDAIVAKFNPDGTLFYSSFLGGRAGGIDGSYERAHAVAADELGHMYVTGATASTINFPIVGGIQSTNRGSFDMFVTKVAPAGGSLVFSTYIGGTLSDQGYDITLDADHNVYVVGNTRSIDNPSTPANEGMPVANAFQPAHGGGISDAFVLKLAAAGNQLLFATYLGGSANESDDGTLVAPTGGIAVDVQGHVYVAGHTTSANFPTTPNRIQPFTGSQDFFITKLTPAGDALVYSTWLGAASFNEACLGLAVDARGSAYVAGWGGPSFPRVNALPPAPGLPTSNVGIKNDAVVAKLTPDGGALVYSTFVGGGMPEVLHDIALDGNGHAYITGVTYSGTYPVVGGVDSTCGCVDGFFEGIPDAFVAKLFLANAAPVAVADAQATDEDVELAVPAPGVLANDTDVNPQDVLTAILVTPPQHGSLALAADGSFTYTPAADFNGTDAFSYTASDGELESGPATVTITVNGTNDAPLADAGGPYIVDEGGTQTLSGTGIDPEGGTLTFDWDLDGDGEFDDATGPSPAYNAGNGPATITVALRVTDGQGASAVDTAAIEIRNVPPVALADAHTTQVGVPLTVPAPGVLANDTDFDPLSAVLVGGPTQGTLTLRADGSFDYAANPGAGGTDTFTYRASDGVAQSAPATVTITLTAPQGLPDAVNDTFVIKKRRHRPHVLNVLGNDSSGPGGGSLRIVGVTQPDHGQVRISRNGRVVIFQAPRRFRGVVTFNYTVRNANNLTDTATVTVHVRRNGPHGDDHDGD